MFNSLVFLFFFTQSTIVEKLENNNGYFGFHSKVKIKIKNIIYGYNIRNYQKMVL